MRTLAFDIETGDFKADIGRMFCWVGKDLVTGEEFVLRRDQHPCRVNQEKPHLNDKHLARRARDIMNSYDIWVSWYGKMFDVPFINTRLLEFGMGELDKKMHCDLLYYARKPHMNLTSARLDNVMKFFGAPVNKTSVDPLIWRDAGEGDESAMDTVVKHCIIDVQGLAHVYGRMKHKVMRLHR